MHISDNMEIKQKKNLKFKDKVKVYTTETAFDLLTYTQ